MDSVKISAPNASLKLSSSKNQRRSSEARKRRYKKKKNIKKNTKQSALLLERQMRVETESQLMKIQWEYKILKRSIGIGKNRKTSSNYAITSRHNYTSIMNMCKDKATSLIQRFENKLTTFRSIDVVVKNELSSGVFGKVNIAFIASIQQAVAVKCFDEKTSDKQKHAEALICTELSGHPNFPYCYGVLDPSLDIIMELIANGRTLRDLLIDENSKFDWRNICLDIVRAINNMHLRGILHNDLHCNNILIRNGKYVKVIDFGKCTLIDEPIMYNIKPGSEKQKKYNNCHAHLGYELCNVPGSKVSPKSDVYSIGYNFRKIAKKVQSSELSSIARSMLDETPSKRLKLSTVLLKLCKL